LFRYVILLVQFFVECKTIAMQLCSVLSKYVTLTLLFQYN
jgi:hypothetical protein